MRKLMYLAIVFSVFSCGQASDKNSEQEKNIEEVHDVQEKKSVKAESKPQIEKLDSIQVDTFPDKIMSDSIETELGFMQQKMGPFHFINDSFQYAVFTRADKNCVYYFLGTIKNNKLHEEAEIGATCDQDFSLSELVWVEPKKGDTTDTHWIEIHSYVPDTFLNEEGMFLEGKTFEDYQAINDTTEYHFSISETDGSIEPIMIQKKGQSNKL